MADEKRTSVASRAELLKKAGFSPSMTVVLLVISMPGFWEAFIDNSDEQANKKAEVGYEVLSKEVEHQREDDKDLEREIQNLRHLVLMLHAQGAVPSVVNPMEDVDADGVPVETSPDLSGQRGDRAVAAPVSRRSRGASGGGSGGPKPESEPAEAPPQQSRMLLPPDVLEDMADQNRKSAIKDRAAMPESLDSLL